MATAHIAYGAVTAWGGQLVYTKAPRIAEEVASSGSSATGSVTAKAGEYARVTATDADIYAAAVATASATACHRITVGSSLDIGPLSEGDKVAIISA